MNRKPRFADYGQETRRFLRAKEFPAISVLMEQDAFLGFFFLDQVRQALKDRLTLKEVNWTEYADQPEMLFGQGDLFSHGQFVIVDGLDHAARFSKAIKVIHRYNQGHDKVLIRKKNIPSGQGFWKEVTQYQLTPIPCVPPYDNEVPVAISLMSKLIGVPLDNSAATSLQNVLGGDLRLLHNEIRKLALIFPDPKKRLSAQDLAPHLEFLRQDHAFKINDLLLAKGNAQASILAGDLVKRGESPIAIVGILARHIRNALQVKQYRSSGVTPRDIASELRLPLRVVSRYTEYSKSISKAQLGRALAQCHEADICLKSSKRDPYIVLDQIVSCLA